MIARITARAATPGDDADPTPAGRVCPECGATSGFTRRRGSDTWTCDGCGAAVAEQGDGPGELPLGESAQRRPVPPAPKPAARPMAPDPRPIPEGVPPAARLLCRLVSALGRCPGCPTGCVYEGLVLDGDNRPVSASPACLGCTAVCDDGEGCPCRAPAGRPGCRGRFDTAPTNCGMHDAHECEVWQAFVAKARKHSGATDRPVGSVTAVQIRFAPVGPQVYLYADDGERYLARVVRPGVIESAALVRRAGPGSEHWSVIEYMSPPQNSMLVPCDETWPDIYDGDCMAATADEIRVAMTPKLHTALINLRRVAKHAPDEMGPQLALVEAEWKRRFADSFTVGEVPESSTKRGRKARARKGE